MAQQASITSLKEAIRLHLEPDIIWSTLPALLDLIAHVGLLVKKLRHEVEQFRDQVEFRGIDQVSLTGICTECESVEGNIWRLSLELRELVSHLHCQASRSLIEPSGLACGPVFHRDQPG